MGKNEEIRRFEEAAYEDQELKDILEEELKPVIFHDEILGDFLLDKRVNTFEKEICWAEENGVLYIDLDDEAEMADSFHTAHVLMEGQREFSRKARQFAAKQLTQLANDWLSEDEEAELDEITEEIFIERISLDTISAYPNGAFEIFYFDGDLFWGHCIIVSGNIDGTFQSADIAG